MTYDGPTDWLLRNRRTGEISLGQAPNLPALIAFASVVALWLFPDSRHAKTLSAVSGVAATWWATAELTSGINPFRRLQGAGVLAFLSSALLRRH